MNETILALDLGTTTGWACRPMDGSIVHGWASFKPGRYEGGGMRYLRFTQWLSELKGHPVTDDNEADALALLHWALEANA